MVPRRRLLEIGDHPQERRLAAARWPDERDELALVDVQFDVTQRHHVAVIGMKGKAETLGLDHALRFAPVSRQAQTPPSPVSRFARLYVAP